MKDNVDVSDKQPVKSIKGTRTAEILMVAFSKESQAGNRYTYYVSTAQKEGYIAVSHELKKMVRYKRAQAARFFSFLVTAYQGEDIPVHTSYSVFHQSTAKNLDFAAGEEKEKGSVLYKTWAGIARQEGFEEIERCFLSVSKANIEAGGVLLSLAETLKKDRYEAKEEKSHWKCLHCGFSLYEKDAPAKCPLCAYPQQYFSCRDT